MNDINTTNIPLDTQSNNSESTNTEPNNKDKIILLKTVQTSSIKNLFESLKEILTDINIEFTESGLKIISMDSTTQTILVHLKLQSPNFEYYYCKEKNCNWIKSTKFL